MMMFPFSDISILQDFVRVRCACTLLRGELHEILSCVNFERNAWHVYVCRLSTRLNLPQSLTFLESFNKISIL